MKRWFRIIIAIEGLDGSGKTTQTQLLVTRLNKEGRDAVYIRPVYFLLHELHLTERDRQQFSPRRNRTTSASMRRSPQKVFFQAVLAIAGYPYALLAYLILAMKYRGRIVICDRYFYQFFYDIYGRWAEYFCRVFPKPDISIYLSCDIDSLYSRMDSQFDRSIDRNYYTGVLAFYSDLAKKYGFHTIDAALPRETVSSRIWSIFSGHSM